MHTSTVNTATVRRRNCI